MKKSDINILVIDDEQLQAEPITKALVRSGFNAKYVRNYDEAQRETQIKDYHLLIVDCMLPRVNGIEVATNMRAKLGSNLKIILISGIFKDNTFKKEAIEKTKAICFLEKPFDIEDILEEVHTAFNGMITPELTPFQQLFTKKFNYDSKMVTDVIKAQGTIHGYEIPFVLTLLNTTKSSGKLTLKGLKEPIHIKFNNGQIFQVDSNDRESYFGVLLIENGFATPEEVAKGLALSSNLPIGQRMWSTNTLSPHAIDLVHQEQLSIRLSKIIQPETFEISFTENLTEIVKLSMTDPSFYRFLNDWISTKVKSDWLMSFFTPWLENPIIKGPNYSLYETLKKIALVSLSPNLNEIISNQMTFSEVMSNNKNKSFLFQSIYFLLLLEILKFSEEKVVSTNFDASLQRLKDLKENLVDKNYYEILGVEKHSPKEKIQQAFHNFAIYLHPDKVSEEAPEELRTLTTEIFQFLTEAHQTLINPQTREKYNFELEHGRAEIIIKTENLFERGLMLLNNNKFLEACECFDEVYQLKLYGDDFLVYYCWALLKKTTPPSQRTELLNLVDEFLSRIPAEIRHSSSYFYVKGLYLKTAESYDKALTAFKHSFTLNPEFKPAQIEWLSIERKMKSSGSGLGSLMNIFKKKTS
ncbi:MAG: response regulator [Bdellovibrionaceae bacterium]|nr:response regulator [Pseudobdellovibrionaceae bacterium]